MTSEDKAAVARVVAEFEAQPLAEQRRGQQADDLPEPPKGNYDFIMGVNAWGKFNVMKWAAQQ